MKWRGVFARRKDDVDEEIASHIEMAIRDRIDCGESPSQARAAAMREFGNVPLIRDVDAAMAPGLWLDRLAGDIRYALRQLTGAPGFAITAILTLALAIGANSAVFTLVHAILLRQLPFDQPSRVFSVENGISAGLGYHMDAQSFAAAFNTAAQSFKTVDAAAMYATVGVNAELTAGRAQRLNATETSAQFLKVLGVAPNFGRSFLPDEDISGKDRVVLISDRLWRGALHRDPNMLGKTIRINGLDFSVAGILPAKMDFPTTTDLWTPTVFDQHTFLREAGAFFAPVIVRSRDGVSAAALRAEFHGRAAQFTHAKGLVPQDEEPILTPIADELTKSVSSSLWTLSGAVAFVLLIACANVACLSLVRTAQRRNEFAVRAALGAGRGRLIQQQLVESSFIASAGGALGVFIAYSMLHLLYVFRPAALDGFARPAIDLQVLAFTGVVALCTGLIFGIVPAWLAGREDPAGALKSGLWRASPGRSRVRNTLIAGEIGIAFVLLAGAGLLMRTLVNMDRVPLGYSVDGVLSFSVSLHGERYGSKQDLNPALAAFYSGVLDRLAAIPGVSTVGAVSNLPLQKRAEMLLDVDAGDKKKPIPALARFASHGYFSVMGIPLLAGRDFSSDDRRSSPRVVIVTRDLAERLWPGRNPIGREMHCEWFCKPAPTVIGVVASNRSFGPREDALPAYFMPYTQQDWPYMTFVLRTRADPAMLIPSVRRAVAAVDPAQPVYDIRTMQQRLHDNESLIRFEVFTLSVFAALSVLLVAIGLYGVISYTVTQRTREIGLRIALGSSRAAILIAVVHESAIICLVGVTIGIASSLLLTRLLDAALFGVKPHDPATLGAVSALFLTIATLASYLPARRAASVDPAQTLRAE